MRDFLRFLLSSADQARVDPASVTVSDVAALPVPGGALAGRGALLISFRVTDPAAGAPQLRPLFPGGVQYLASAGAPGTLPEPDAVVLTAAGHATWRTLGSIAIRIKDKNVRTGLEEHGLDLEVMPTVSWYAPVRLTEAFMLTTLIAGLAKAKIARPPSIVKPSDAAWPRHAVSGFLRGTYQPELRLGARAADDDVVKHAMPAVEMAANGQVSLFITMATAHETPQDGEAGALDALAGGRPRTDPAHPINAGIPARHVYRRVRSRLLDGAVGRPVADRILADWPLARRYFPLFVTRTW